MENTILKYLKEREEKEIPTNKYEKIFFEDGKELKIGKQLNQVEKEELKAVLERNLDIFAWDISQITGIDSSIIEHKLCTNPAESPVKQKLRTLGPERRKAAKTEIEKLLQAEFIREVKYPK